MISAEILALSRLRNMERGKETPGWYGMTSCHILLSIRQQQSLQGARSEPHSRTYCVWVTLSQVAPLLVKVHIKNSPREENNAYFILTAVSFGVFSEN